MNENITRRDFASGLGATAVVGLPFVGGEDVSDTTIDVNFFVGENIIDVASSDTSETEKYSNPGKHYSETTESDPDPLYPINRIAEHVEYSFNELFSRFNQNIQIDITVVEDPVPTEEFEPDETALLRPWEDYLYNTLDESDRADDSNILIVLDPASEYNWKGNAYYPCSVCHGGNETAGVVYDVNHGPFTDMEPGEIQTEFESGMRGRIATAVHEVGHTVGLRHGDGDVLMENGEKVITPMKDSGNHDYDKKRLLFSDSIEPSDLRDDDSGGLPFGNLRRGIGSLL